MGGEERDSKSIDCAHCGETFDDMGGDVIRGGVECEECGGEICNNCTSDTCPDLTDEADQEIEDDEDEV